MKWQLRLGKGKLVLSAMLICCLWVCAVPAAARAQAKFSSATCSVQVVKGKMVTYQIKGTAQVTGLVPQNASATVNFKFQTSTMAGVWSDMSQGASVTTTGVDGTANFDTSWLMMGAPANGQQYRVVCSGGYIDGSGKLVAIPGTTSDPITPSP